RTHSRTRVGAASAGALQSRHESEGRWYLRRRPKNGRSARALPFVALRMTARVENATVRADHDRSLAASFEIRNVSAEPWRPSGGFAISYRIFDPQTGTLIVDGPRLAPERDVAPGETRLFDLQLELPAEPGRYRIFVSAMQDDVCWLYERGAEFLLIDSAVDSEGARVENFRVATERTVRRERFLRSMRRAFTLPIESV